MRDDVSFETKMGEKHSTAHAADRLLKILQVNTADLGGGAENSTWNLFQAYRRAGHNSKLVVGRKYSDDPDVLQIPRPSRAEHWTVVGRFLYRQLAPFEGRVRGAGLLRQWLWVLAGRRSRLETELGYEDFHYPESWNLLDLMKPLPDIVHAHNLHGGYFDLRFLPVLSHRVPLILNLRDPWLLSGHCAHSFECARWKTGCGQCPDLSIYPAIKRDATAYNWKRKREIYARSRVYITAPSQWLMDKVQQSMLRGLEYRVIPNGVDLNVFHPGDQIAARQSLGLPLEPRIILFVGNNARRTRWKDYDTMEAAVRQVASHMDTDLIFLCLGQDGEEQNFGKARILYAGFENNQQTVSRYYQASDLYIHAAKADTFPRVVIEALACGLPVVGTAVGGIPEQIVNGVTGFLVPSSDAAGMASRIEKLLLDDELRLRFSRAAILDVQQRFSLERQVEAFLTWYQEIIIHSSSQSAS